MKHASTLVAGLALAGSAAAQQGITLDTGGWLGPSRPSARFTLSAHFPPSDYAFAGVRVDILSEESGWSDPELLSGGSGPGTSPGVISGSDMLGIIAGQVHFPAGGIYADPTNPIDIWRATFTITDYSARRFYMELRPSMFSIYPDRMSPLSEPRSIDAVRVPVDVHPTPGTLAALSLGGLIAARRRR